MNSFTYYYRITAVDTTGNESPAGGLITGTPTDKTPPAAPMGLSIVNGDHVVELTWSANSEADMAYYHIYRSTDSTFSIDSLFVPEPEELLDQVPKIYTSYKDTTVNNGTVYYYRLIAVDIGNNAGLPSDAVDGLPVDLPPSPPQGLAALSGDGRITLNWASGDEYDLIGYIIYRNTDSTFTPTSNDSITAVMFPAIAYIDSGLTTGLAYYYRLSSFDEGGNICLLYTSPSPRDS